METYRLHECYDGQAVFGGDLGNAILLGYFSQTSAKEISIFRQKGHNSLVRVDHAPPFCVGMCERIRHCWPL